MIYVATVTDTFQIGTETIDLVRDEQVNVSAEALEVLIANGHVVEGDEADLPISPEAEEAHHAVVEKAVEQAAQTIAADAEKREILETVEVIVVEDAPED
jgi:hypothetical protein